MNKHSVLLVMPLLLAVLCFGQKKVNPFDLVPISEAELLKLASFSQYKPQPTDSPISLPYSVDNTLQPYFRPLFNQSGLECGQAASIGLNFTYEMDWIRNLPANISQNQYATHFTYNFLNGGSDAGVSYFETWEIVKRCGTPTVAEYGGLASGGASRWMSGYDKYYNAMHNRILDVYAINASDTEGLNTLKNWIYNHSNTSQTGGLANIYIQYKSPDAQLAAGTPEAGKWVITTWGGSPNHAVTLVGYNDSIRYDYNNDGLYTNNIDINGDGAVNVKDWEIGGFKLANTYGGINNWGDQGFSYVMYKTFADELGSGGVWNHAAHIIKVKQDVSPKLTFKITLKHSSRNKIKIMCGVAENPLATEPDNLLNLPIFDFQGGDKYMQGGTTEADKTIELGIDATPLLSDLDPGLQTAFFLLVKEDDASATATGQIVSFSIIDYNGTTTEIPYGSNNIPLVENGITLLKINHFPLHNKPVITNNSLPEAKIYESYSTSLSANAGTPAYKWKFMCDYNETTQQTPFPTVNAQQLSISNSSSGFTEVVLPFEFPFYGKKYTKVYPHVDGYLMFQPDLMPWTFVIYEKTLLKNMRNISPYMSKPLNLYPAEGDGIWYEGTSEYAIFRWKSAMYGSGPSTELNFATKIYPDGKIEFYYGNIVSNSWVKWNSGISNGDGTNYLFSSACDSLSQPTANSMYRYTTPDFPYELSLSEDGQLSGTPSKVYQNVPIKFYAEDNNTIHDTKTLNFSTTGLRIEYLVSSGTDSIIDYGETTQLTAKLTNIGTAAIQNINLYLSINDAYITTTDSTETLANIEPGEEVIITNCFSFQVNGSTPDQHEIISVSVATTDADTYSRTIPFTVNSPDLYISGLSIQDGNNNILMPGESGTLLVTIKNKGGSSAQSIFNLLASVDPLLSVQIDTATIVQISGNGMQTIAFQITASPNCPTGHLAFLKLSMQAAWDYATADSVYFTIGTVAEDFETGDLLKYPWQSGGNASWSVSGVQPYEGSYCAASPALADNQYSTIFVQMDILCASEISFYRRVSSEANYDFLTFYIDGVEQIKWSGEVPWGKVSFAVEAGTHTLSWKYSKDVNTIAGSDKAWIDFVVWPPYSDLLLIADAGVDASVCYPPSFQLEGNSINATSINWSSSGDGYFSNPASLNSFYTPGSLDLIEGIVTLTLMATGQSAPTVSDEMQLAVYQSVQVSAGSDASVCGGSNFSITSSSSNYSMFNWSTTGDGLFSSTNVLFPVYTPGASDILNGSVHLILSSNASMNCSPSADTMLLTIHPMIIANAGSDQSIAYNTSTQLDGTVGGGTGNLQIQWQPEDKLVYAAIPDPFTLVLNSSVAFTLTVTDLQTQCAVSDQTFVNVTGSPLSVNATASPEKVCLNSSSQLTAIAGGGSGSYTYIWTSAPSGFNSNIYNPLVYPNESTIYTVSVNDGVNTMQASVQVSVDNPASAPSKPTGPSLVNTFLNSLTTYSTTSVNTNTYQWILTPVESGTLQSDSTHCTILWDQNFNGTAFLTVAGVNSCGIGNLSEQLTITASAFVSENTNRFLQSISIYPSPAKDEISVNAFCNGTGTISIIDGYGRLIMRKANQLLNSDVKLDVTDLAPETYFVIIESGTDRKVARFVKMK